MSAFSRSDLQALLADGGASRWAPRNGETPAATLARTSPPQPPWTQPLRRLSYRRAIAAAEQFFLDDVTPVAWAAPMWIGDNEGDEPADCWEHSVVIVDEFGCLALGPTAVGGCWASLRVKQRYYGYVVAAEHDDLDRSTSRSGAPLAALSITSPFDVADDYEFERFGPWLAVCHNAGALAEVEAMLDGGAVPALPRPTTLVPARCVRAFNAIDETTLPEAARAAFVNVREHLNDADDVDDADDDEASG